MATDTSVISAATALISAVVGPVVTIFLANRQANINRELSKNQIKASTELSEKQIAANVISNNRQKWIDALRDVLADFQAKTIQLRYLSTKSKDREWHNDPLFSEIIALRSRADLMLNPNEDDHKDLIAILARRVDLLAYPMNNELFREETILSGKTVTLSQAILKREWERVKAGERL